MKTTIPAVKCWLAIIAFPLALTAKAQDTIRLTVAQGERLFLQKNFLLLAGKYQVSAADAAIIQAKLYPNPTLSIDQGAYNQETKKFFALGSQGQTAIALQQVITLAGKRNRQIELAKMNAQVSVYQFYDLIRTLRYELRSAFYSLYYLEEPINVYDREIASLKILIDAYTVQYNNGNIAFKDLARLQALQFSLQNERLELIRQAMQKQATLSLLVGDTLMQPVKPLMEPQLSHRIDVSALNYQQLIDSAMSNRYDLRLATAQAGASEANLGLQKALRVPDITLGLNYDKAGSYVRNYNSISLAIDLPVSNRNQGNIKAAQFQLQANKDLQAQAALQIQNDITSALRQLIEIDKLYQLASPQFTTDYDKLLEGITRAYQNHTISLLEFIDYYETYKNSKLELTRLQNSRIEAFENLNLATGTTIIK